MRILNICLTIIIIQLFVCGIGCSKGDREIKPEQLQERGDGLYYAVNEEKPYSGKVVQLYNSGQKKLEVNLKNGRLHVLNTRWYDNQQKQLEGAYKDGKEDGHWTTWYKNGQKEKEGSYKEGKKEDKWDFWTQAGQKIETGEVKDTDGNIYMTIKIGGQWWMAENLKVTHYRNGDPVPIVKEKGEWSDLKNWTKGTIGIGAYCSYNNNKANAETYGHLYNWAVNDRRGLAPQGWHIPSDAEWEKLVEYLGGDDVAGGKMKETGTTRWREPNTGATNESRFSALPGGCRKPYGAYYSIGTHAIFWSSTEYGKHRPMSDAWACFLWNGDMKVSRGRAGKQHGYSVHCVRD